MVYTIKYIKKHKFLADARMKQKDAEGDIVSDKSYVKNTFPKSLTYYCPAINYRTNHIANNLDQTQLNKLVEEIGLYDMAGNPITKAPLNNPNAPFWKHPDLKIGLLGAGQSLNDDFPMDRFWLSCFRADPKFMFSGDDVPPSLMTNVYFKVTRASEDADEKSQETDLTFKALKVLSVNEDDHEKLSSMLRAMGTDVRSANPKLVKEALLRKITEYKDQIVPGRSETNIEYFIKLGESSTKELVISELISLSRTKGFIQRNKNNQYIFGDLILGKNLQEVESFLTNPENALILEDISSKIKK